MTRILRSSDDARLGPRAYVDALARVREGIGAVPDFPEPGILFRDITPVLASPETLHAAMDLHLHHLADLVGAVDRVLAIESRGFLFGMGVAERLGIGFVPVRKPGKLPRPTVERSYALEYGTDRLQCHADAIGAGDRVVVVDDLLATGGTANAACELAEELGGHVVANLFLIELEALGGRARLDPRRVESIIRY